MKRVLVALLCFCVLSVPALAVELSDFETTADTGETYVDRDAYNAAVAAEKIAAAGLPLDVDSYWVTNWLGITYFDNEAFEFAYAEAFAASQEPEQSDGADYAFTDTAASDEPTDDVSADDKYPLGSFVDEEGNVYSPEGELLSSGSQPVSYLDTIGSLLDAVPDSSDEMLADNEEPEPHIYNVVDLRSDAGLLPAAEGDLSGLKSLVLSIFGEYAPVKTTSTVIETVDGVTTTTLIDVVAAGAAGVDYAWISGVFLFGILLFCLMKLLGGILK